LVKVEHVTVVLAVADIGEGGRLCAGVQARETENEAGANEGGGDHDLWEMLAAAARTDARDFILNPAMECHAKTQRGKEAEHAETNPFPDWRV